MRTDTKKLVKCAAERKKSVRCPEVHCLRSGAKVIGKRVGQDLCLNNLYTDNVGTVTI